MTPQFTHWFKSSRSGPQANCVEVSVSGDHLAVGVRDSKAPAAGHLTLTPTAWASFVTDVKAGAFDHR